MDANRPGIRFLVMDLLQLLDGVLRSMASASFVSLAPTTHEVWGLTPDGVDYEKNGSPEAQVFAAIPPGVGLTLDDVKVQPNPIVNLGDRHVRTSFGSRRSWAKS